MAMHFRLHDGEGTHSITLEFGELIIAGMTGRDVKAVQAHIDEPVEIGVPAPSIIPIYYLVSATLLTTANRFQVTGEDSSGEVEAVLLGTPEGMLVGVGSDHTDRKMETDSIAISKQVCPKSISRDLWQYADVVAGWDDIELVSDRIVDGVRTPSSPAPTTSPWPWSIPGPDAPFGTTTTRRSCPWSASRTTGPLIRRIP
jgi:hypothetical protein